MVNAASRAWLRLLAVVLAAGLSFGCAQGDPAGAGASRSGLAASARDEATARVQATEREEGTRRVPERAIAVYRHVMRTGQAPKGHVGGRVFENREGLLPRGGRYREYDVNPRVAGRTRDAERVVIDRNAGAGWYTPDHYRSFRPIERSAK